MALPGLYLDEPGCPGVLPGLYGLDGRPSRFFGKKTSFSPGSSRSMKRDDPGGSGINRSTAGLSGTGAYSLPRVWTFVTASCNHQLNSQKRGRMSSVTAEYVPSVC